MLRQFTQYLNLIEKQLNCDTFVCFGIMLQLCTDESFILNNVKVNMLLLSVGWAGTSVHLSQAKCNFLHIFF